VSAAHPAAGADVVIAGYGPAGASAAIAAHDAGARVVVVDSAPRGGGNARYSGGFLCDFTQPAAADHLDALCFGRTDRLVLETYAAGLHGLGRWLTSLGGAVVPFDPPPGRFPAPFPSWPRFPGGTGVRYHLVQGAGRPGESLWHLLDAAVRARGIEVLFGTEATSLAAGSCGSVTGLCVAPAANAEPAGEPVTLPARGGVVLATGGFEGSPALTDAYLPLGPVRPVGHPGNTGGGLRMAQAAGAALWHMYGFFGWFAFAAPEFASPFAIDFCGPSYLVTDADGRRFADETGYEVHDRLRALLTCLPRHPGRPRLPSWAIFDEAGRCAGPLSGRLGTPNDYAWSPDTLDPLDTRRLYAIETWPGLGGTTGGPRHDERARVLGVGGDLIPGLYAAGSVSAIWGHLTEHGGGLTDAIVFGRCAGAEAAARARSAGAEAAARADSARAPAAGRAGAAGTRP
jgi:succinate dehydrogenase/fumarate reductase flavoprotein subunit